MSIADKKDFTFAGFSSLFRKKAAWIGEYSPIRADEIAFQPMLNYRLSTTLHGMYDVVWIYEKELFSHDNWELVYDESLRLLKKNGYFIIRLRDSLENAIFLLKSRLGRNPLLKVSLQYQEKLQDGSIVCIFYINRLYFKNYKKRDWSVGIVHNGENNENIARLVYSIESIRPDDVCVEYLIAGPVVKEVEKNFLDSLAYIETDLTDDLPRISEKKEKIIERAKYANIIILHNRFVLNKDFFYGFEKYGYDFDYITINQFYDSGEIYPGYAALPERELKHQYNIYDSTFSTIEKGQYINGGLTILKKHIHENMNGFNELLLHNEAEDVELAYYLRFHGIIPRINIFSTAYTIGVPLSRTAGFIDVSL
ncbi:hypothetical protein NB646_07900 [Oxalobacter aliiformigenes]|uniref:Uncharacterized protein n=1 Tax=Oxalobacter aliiformigenes TaxID=2946593 RepID=A0A9E9NSK6_9BURK|nr:hypothetical protein [Oxalobacter aliiformigenes]WAV90763.1 hypothetical protein NB646_07900 [Oxalobacter aliiformigenes]WAV92801.1 hypothetical protein NB641_08375 [Oxalobacter aliiformigenes]WAV95694.1 hypothetical protein NB643_02740 [Oxalobacter aliiformigenes]WAV96511.1 hypothetical protein NB645_06645 [Oxalobacter aliiformigenes]